MTESQTKISERDKRQEVSGKIRGAGVKEKRKVRRERA